MTTDIYYFSGTCNSLFVARELQKKLPGSRLIPIVSLLQQDLIPTTADTIGIVCPLHGMTIPVPVKKFIEKIRSKSSPYIFAVVTRGGTDCYAFSAMNKILRPKGFLISGQFILNMATNDPKFEVYDIPTGEELDKKKIEIQKELDVIQEKILNRKIIEAKDVPLDGLKDHYSIFAAWVMKHLILLAMRVAEKFGVNDYFYSDDKCTGCGTCERVCLSGKIRLVDHKPVWVNEAGCHLCYACLNFCPRQAVQIKTKWYMKSYTPQNGRYPHPYASVQDMVAQKSTPYAST